VRCLGWEGRRELLCHFARELMKGGRAQMTFGSATTVDTTATQATAHPTRARTQHADSMIGIIAGGTLVLSIWHDRVLTTGLGMWQVSPMTWMVETFEGANDDLR
jgi:hypothetical protein